MSSSSLINRLGLQELPQEGGWFRELRHLETGGMGPLPGDMGAVGADCEGSSSIYYLIRGWEGSAWHKLGVDEYWCFHLGDNIR